MNQDEKKIDNSYVFGEGKIAVGSGKTSILNSEIIFPMITISKKTKKTKIGLDLMGLEDDTSEMIVLAFKNIEGFKVFKKMVDNVEKLFLDK